MSRELNKIFDVQSRQARIDILDKFDLSADDKNKVLNKIANSGGNNDASQYSPIYYKIKQNWISGNDDFKHLMDFSVIQSFFNYSTNPSQFTYYSWTDVNNGFLLAIGVLPQRSNDGGFNSLEDVVNDGTIEPIDELVERITAEEFYNSDKLVYSFNLLIPSDIYTGDTPIPEEFNATFKTYQFEAGMTWKQWLNSKYNVDNFSIVDKNGNELDGPYIYVPYMYNGERPVKIYGHDYNHPEYNKHIINYFHTYEYDTDKGNVLCALKLDGMFDWNNPS